MIDVLKIHHNYCDVALGMTPENTVYLQDLLITTPKPQGIERDICDIISTMLAYGLSELPLNVNNADLSETKKMLDDRLKRMDAVKDKYVIIKNVVDTYNVRFNMLDKPSKTNRVLLLPGEMPDVKYYNGVGIRLSMIYH